MDDRERWDARHAGAGEVSPPDGFVLRALDALAAAGAGAGRALDLAAGTGRHALELARRGWSVAAWDVSPVALERLARRAAALGLAVETRAVDLTGELPDERCDLAVLASYLDRGLLARLHELVRPGGHLAFATFTVDRPGDHPRLEWCLARGEIERGVAGFDALLTEERDGRAGLLARRR